MATAVRGLTSEFTEPAVLGRPMTFAEMVDRTLLDRRKRAILGGGSTDSG